MPDTVIYKNEGDFVLVDDGGELWPYEFRLDTANDKVLLGRDEAVDVAKAILANENESVGNAVRASEVSFNEGLIRLAAVHGKVVTFRYAKGDGSVIEQRTLKPETVKEVNGHVTFTGYDPDRDEPRAYRVDRMKGEVSVA